MSFEGERGLVSGVGDCMMTDVPGRMECLERINAYAPAPGMKRKSNAYHCYVALKHI